jgi:glycerophosphoryl diester phosphodiesterase
MGSPRVIAHRGDSSLRPENTLAAFAAALEAGADIVEIDVQLTRDRHVVVLHDPLVDRTTDGLGRVADYDLRDLRALSAGHPSVFGSAFAGERVPTLIETLHFLKGRARVVIEIKVGGPRAAPDDDGGLEALTLADVHRAGMQREVALLSFDSDVLRRCGELDPQVPRGHLFVRASVDELLAGAEAVRADFVLPEKGLLSPELLRRTRAAGLRVATWLVDDPAELPGLLQYDLFGIGTNRPGALLEALAAAG